jgi:succinoglycan biosynthesis protein ExoA
MKISVIVPCRNESRHIGEFLDSVLAQQLEPECEIEILVADGMSDDGTRDVLRAARLRHPAIRVIDNPGGIVSTGLNAAIGAATGGVVVRMDVHTTYAPDYIRQCVRTLWETGADNVGGPWVAEGRGFLGKAIAAAFQSPFCAGGGKAHDPGYEGEVDTVYLGCWPRSVFDRIGMFDPGLVRNQDDEINFRLRRMGGRIWQSPKIRSAYVPRASIRRLFRQYLQYGFWRVAVIRKHRAVASWRHIVPALFAAWVLLAPVLIGATAALDSQRGTTVLGVAFAATMCAYLLACLAAAFQLRRSLHIFSLLMLPIVMATYHFAYGLGFLLAVLKRPARGQHSAPDPVFTALTR